MRYFNGFCLKGEEIFLSDIVVDSAYSIVGFSYGAQKAFEYAYNHNSKERIDRLILISPAFFQDHKKSFIKTQLCYFKADEMSYKKTFLKNVVSPSTEVLDAFMVKGSFEELEALLSYVWERDKIEELLNRGVTIEVFMGGEDKIVEHQKSFDFFSTLVPVYLFKDKGHLLLNEEL